MRGYILSIFRISEAADVLGVSADTVRRWIDEGRLAGTRSRAGHRQIAGTDLAFFARALAEQPDLEMRSHRSARNRLAGIVTAVEKDRVAARVEIQAGPHRMVALLTREAVDDLGLEPGVRAVAVVKATNVMVELP